MIRPVLFLDIDGVLNGIDLDIGDSPEAMPVMERQSRHMLRPHVSRLVRVLQGADCDVVVSSTWRKRFTAQQVAEMLVMRGMPHELAVRFIGVTDEQPVPYDWPNRSGRERGLQIQRWLDANPDRDRFAIVDDDSDMAHLMDWLVQASALIGMTDDDADRLIEMMAE